MPHSSGIFFEVIMLVIKRNQDFIATEADIYVCPVNAGGVMGCGVALHFKNKMGAVGLQDYYRACGNGEMFRKGCVIVEGSYKIAHGAPIALLATKRIWQEPGNAQLIKRGLEELKERALDILFIDGLDEVRISMPAIGCGRAGMSLGEVIPLVESVFGRDQSIQVFFHILD